MAITPIGAGGIPPTPGIDTRKSGEAFQNILEAVDAKAVRKNAEQELEEYVKMTPEQRMRVELLKKLGLTEEDLAAMPPGERQAIETKLKEMVQEMMQAGQAKKGTQVDTSA